MVYLRDWGTRLNTAWQRVKTQLTLSSEPQVWQSMDISGHSVWSAYEPATGRAIDHVSEHEMRVWLEERYHHEQSVSEQRVQHLKAASICQM